VNQNGAYFDLPAVKTLIAIDLANHEQNSPSDFAKTYNSGVSYKYGADAASTANDAKNAHGLSSVTFQESDSSGFIATAIHGGAENLL
jgi:hypothetical protein